MLGLYFGAFSRQFYFYITQLVLNWICNQSRLATNSQPSYFQLVSAGNTGRMAIPSVTFDLKCARTHMPALGEAYPHRLRVEVG